MKYQPVPWNPDSAVPFSALFNRLAAASEEGAPAYLPLTPDMTASLLLPGFPFPDPEAASDRVKTAVLALDPDDLDDDPVHAVGFAAGNASHTSETAYVTALVTDRRGGEAAEIRRGLLSALTKELLAIHPSIARIRWVFYNPALLPWHLPDLPAFASPDSALPLIHPGAPGVMETDPVRETLLCEGWREFASLTAYGRRLGDYEVPEPLLGRMRDNASRGLTVELYDPARHGSFLPLLDALGSEDWRRAVLSNAVSPEPLPMMIAADRSGETLRKNGGLGFVCGFAGPLKRTENGRGYFAGIGIHPDYRVHGLGSTLFAALCRGLREIGADYMTLFTGTDGVAAKIYEKAGFTPAARFLAMEKRL